MRSGLGSRFLIGARLVARVTHRSRAGRPREISIFGVPACARCTAIVVGVAAGASVATAWPPPAWVLLACVPAGLDAVVEKLLGRGHRPRLLVATNALAGFAVGGVLVALSLRHGPLVTVAVLLVPRPLLRLSAPWQRRRPPRPPRPARPPRVARAPRAAGPAQHGVASCGSAGTTIGGGVAAA
jgi:uncharacterized membrane protein